MGLAPALTSYDPADLLLPDSELFRELTLEDSASLPSTPDLAHLLDRQEVHSVCLSRIIGLLEPSLGKSVTHIRASSSQPPVAIVLAGPEVAGMTNFHVICDRTDSQLVSEAVGIDHPVRSAIAIGPVPEEAVSTQLGVTWKLSAGSSPGPAVIRPSHFDFGPVPDLDGQALSCPPSFSRGFTHNVMLYHHDDVACA